MQKPTEKLLKVQSMLCAFLQPTKITFVDFYLCRLPAIYLGQITDGLYLISLLLKVSEQAGMADQSTLLTQTDVVCPQTIPRLFHARQMVTFLENKKKQHFISSSPISHFFCCIEHLTTLLLPL